MIVISLSMEDADTLYFYDIQDGVARFSGFNFSHRFSTVKQALMMRETKEFTNGLMRFSGEVCVDTVDTATIPKPKAHR